MEKYRIDLVNETFEVEFMKDHEIGLAAQLFLDAMSKGDGLSLNEFESAEHVKAYLGKGPVMLVKDITGNVVGVLTMRISPLVRSQNSMYHAGYMILKPETRNKGLAISVVQTLHGKFTEQYGYSAAVARTATVSRGLQLAVRNKWTIMGTIPNSMYFPQYGWVDDLICYSSTEADDEAGTPIFEDPGDIPPLQAPDLKFLLNDDRLSKVPLPDLETKDDILKVNYATKNDVIPVEEMIREAALEGKGFAADEFTEDGYMNRVLLLRSHTVVFNSADGEIRAAIIFGPTSICREKSTRQAGGYMIVKKDDRGRGLGNAILDYCLKNMGKLGYTAIITDVFVYNLPMLKMLQKRGFMATATIPNSGIINGHGRTNTYLMYKQMKNLKTSML